MHAGGTKPLRFPSRSGETSNLRLVWFPSRSGGNLKEGGIYELWIGDWYKEDWGGVSNEGAQGVRPFHRSQSCRACAPTRTRLRRAATAQTQQARQTRTQRHHRRRLRDIRDDIQYKVARIR